MARTSIDEILAESERLEQQQPRVRLHLILPPAIFGSAIALLWATRMLGNVSAAAAASFFTLGKFIIAFGAVPDETFKMTALQLAGMVVFMDILYAYFLAYNLHHVYRVKRFGIGPALQRLVSYCQYWLHARPWMRRWAFTGVMLFVLFPLTGTGAPGGSILGRLVGLRPRTTLIAITTGSVLSCALMAAFATRLEPVFEGIKETWWFTASGILILVIVVVALFILGRKLSRAAEEYARSDASGGET